MMRARRIQTAVLGVVLMLIGRLIYGHWRAAAPIARVTGAVTRVATAPPR